MSGKPEAFSGSDAIASHAGSTPAAGKTQFMNGFLPAARSSLALPVVTTGNMNTVAQDHLPSQATGTAFKGLDMRPSGVGKP